MLSGFLFYRFYRPAALILLPRQSFTFPPFHRYHYSAEIMLESAETRHFIAISAIIRVPVRPVPPA